MFDAVKLQDGLLAGDNQIPFLDVYQGMTNEFFTELRAFGKAVHPAPLAIIVTQRCRLEAMRAKLNANRQQALGPVAVVRERLSRRLREIVALSWIRYAELSHLPRPKVGMFWISAVVTTHPDNDLDPIGIPLRDQYCLEPVCWMVAQVIRAKLGMLDFMLGGRTTDLMEAVSHLEAVAGRYRG